MFRFGNQIYPPFGHLARAEPEHFNLSDPRGGIFFVTMKTDTTLRGCILRAKLHAERLYKRKNLGPEFMNEVCAIMTNLTLASTMVGPELPGMTEQLLTKFEKPSLEQVHEYAQSNPRYNITWADAEWFWSKCQGNGWKNGGKAIVDWRATLRAWSLAKYLPSQKQQVVSNGRVVAAVKQATITERALDKELERVRHQT
jgi:hypothetical protein